MTYRYFAAVFVASACLFPSDATARGNAGVAAQASVSVRQHGQHPAQGTPQSAAQMYVQHQQKYPGATALNPYGAAMRYDSCSMRPFYY